VSVLAVGRNGAALARFRDVLPIFSNDPRIRVRYAAAPGSPHADGNARLLGGLGAKSIAWADAVGERHRLALATSPNGGLHQLRGPVLLLPHGAGRHKLVDGHPYGLSSAQLTYRGRVIPEAIGISHADQLEVLSRSCPEALDRAVLVGDPCYDRLAAAAHLRPRLRRGLGLAPDRELVVISSTWGSSSLFETLPDLPERLLEALPADQYAVALVLHPNIWSEYGRDQIVGRWYERAVRAGLLIVPWEEGWQAALLSADYVIGDHGSVTYYAAVLGKPVLLGSFSTDGLVPDTALTRFAERAPRLEPRADLAAQLVAAAGEASGRADASADLAFPLPGRSLETIRDVAYRLMRLDPPSSVLEPPSVGVPASHIHAPTPTAYRVFVDLLKAKEPADSSRMVARVERIAAVLSAESPERARMHHIAADLEHPQLRHLRQAAVIYARGSQPASVDRDAVFRDYPGARVFAGVDGETCTVLLAEGPGASAVVRGADPVLAASLVYARLSGILPGAAFDPAEIEVGGGRTLIEFTGLP
jgi:hypothetical protein